MKQPWQRALIGLLLATMLAVAVAQARYANWLPAATHTAQRPKSWSALLSLGERDNAGL
jgi:hypothetical protein